MPDDFERPTPEDKALTEAQLTKLRDLVRDARDVGVQPEADEEALIDLSHGEAEEMIERLQDLLDESRAR